MVNQYEKKNKIKFYDSKNKKTNKIREEYIMGKKKMTNDGSRIIYLI